MRTAIIILVTILLTGCQVPNHVSIPGESYAIGNVQDGGNMHLHLSNQGRQSYAYISFRIDSLDKSTQNDPVGEASLLLGADPHRETVFSYLLKPGKYRVTIDDGVMNDGEGKNEWKYDFVVSNQGKLFLSCDYWVIYEGEKKIEKNQEVRIYKSRFTFGVGDSRPRIF